MPQEGADVLLYIDREVTSVAEVNAALDEIWMEWRESGRHAELTERERSDLLIVSDDGAGVVGGLLGALVFFRPALNEIVARVGIDVWERLILPRLEAKLGHGSVSTAPPAPE